MDYISIFLLGTLFGAFLLAAIEDYASGGWSFRKFFFIKYNLGRTRPHEKLPDLDHAIPGPTDEQFLSWIKSVGTIVESESKPLNNWNEIRKKDKELKKAQTKVAKDFDKKYAPKDPALNYWDKKSSKWKTNKASKVNKDISTGTYSSVDRVEAVKANWDTIQKMTKPGDAKNKSKSKAKPKGKKKLK